MASSSASASSRNKSSSLYLAYTHTYHNSDQITDLNPDLILTLPNDGTCGLGMKSAIMGTRLYILGGALNYEDPTRKNEPRDVYVFDLSKSLPGKVMSKDDADCVLKMNASKINPIVFSANGMLHALDRFPFTRLKDRKLKLEAMELFERFDPATSSWTVLPNIPEQLDHVDSIAWVGCTVLPMRQQVVVVGIERTYMTIKNCRVQFVYNLKTEQWKRCPLGRRSDLFSGSFQEVREDKNYIYGLHCSGLPVKLKLGIQDEVNKDLGYTSIIDHDDYNSNYDDDDDDDDDDDEDVDDDDDRLLELTILNEPENVWMSAFRRRYLIYSNIFLRYIANDRFCFISSGMMPTAGLKGGDFDPDPCASGVSIVLFMDMGDKKAFNGQVLQYQKYIVKTDFETLAELTGCFVITHNTMKNWQKKMSRKKKNVGSEYTSSYTSPGIIVDSTSSE